MSADTWTHGISGKQGKLVLNGRTIRLTSWSMPTRVDKVEITNSESPATTLNNGVSLVSGEYIPGVFDAEITFEGIYTVLENATGPEYTETFGASTVTTGIAPGFGVAPSTGRGTYAATLTPDRVITAATFTGNVLVTNLEVTGKLREGETYKGSGIFSGGLTVAHA